MTQHTDNAATAPVIDLDRLWKQMPKADRLVLLGTDADSLTAEERALFLRVAAGLRGGTANKRPRPARRGR